MEGRKHDQGKYRYDLITPESLADLAAVLTMGAAKYEANNWQKVDQAESRYYAALMRHVEAFRRGEYLDKESGLPHMAHAMCNCMFLHHIGRRERHESTNVRPNEDRDNPDNTELRGDTQHGLFDDHEERNILANDVRTAARLLDKLRTYITPGTFNCHSQNDGSVTVVLSSDYTSSPYVAYLSESALPRLLRLADRLESKHYKSSRDGTSGSLQQSIHSLSESNSDSPKRGSTTSAPECCSRKFVDDLECAVLAELIRAKVLQPERRRDAYILQQIQSTVNDALALIDRRFGSSMSHKFV